MEPNAQTHTAAGAGAPHRPKVAILRGSAVNPWELRAWEGLQDRYDVSVLVPPANQFEHDDVGVTPVPAATALGYLPPAVSQRAANRIDRYVGLPELLRGTEIVHAAEINSWFSAQAAQLRAALGYKLVLTVWETIPFATAYRGQIGRRRRAQTLPHVDLFLPTTERARLALELEGVDPERIVVSGPGIDAERFAAARTPQPASDGRPVLLSVARLVWEKGLQDAIRALALVHRSGRPDAVLEVVGVGPDRERLEQYAAELGLADSVRFLGAVPYDELPRTYARASGLVLVSLPVPSWDEQFGMVLAEAMAGGLPIVASRCGAIAEVVGEPTGDGAVELVAPGDWPALAETLLRGPLADQQVRRFDHSARVEGFTRDAAADRLAAAYDRVLGR